MSNVSSKEHLKPKSTWQKFSCVVKRVFANYALAVQEQQKMEMQTDTEDEEAVESLTYTQQNLPAPTIKHSYAVNKINKPEYDFNNYLITLPPSNQLDNNKQPPAPPIFALNEDTLVGQNISLSDVNLESPFLVSSQNDNATILQNQKRIIELLESQKENTSKILSQLAKHEVIFEELYKKVGRIEQNHASFIPGNGQNNVLFERFPAVKSVKELQELEEKLKEPSFRKRYIDCMSVLCSEGSSLRGNNLCYKMVDFFMARDIFLECSWTGNTRDDLRTEKKPFKFFENVRATFLSVIRTTDQNFGQLQCDDFFKRIIKNSKQRFEAATKPIKTSTPKRNFRKRPRTEPPQEDMEIEQALEEMEAEHPGENRESAREFQEEWEAREYQEDREVGKLQEEGEARQHQECTEDIQHLKDMEVKQRQEGREARQRQEGREIKHHQKDREGRQHQECRESKEHHKGRENIHPRENRESVREYQEDREVKQHQEGRKVRQRQQDIEVEQLQEEREARQRQEGTEDIQHQEDREVRQHQEGRKVRQRQEDIGVEQLQEEREARQRQEGMEDIQHQEDREVRQRQEGTEARHRQEGREVKHHQEDREGRQHEEGREARQRQKGRESRQQRREDREVGQFHKSRD